MKVKTVCLQQDWSPNMQVRPISLSPGGAPIDMMVSQWSVLARNKVLGIGGEVKRLQTSFTIFVEAL